MLGHFQTWLRNVDRADMRVGIGLFLLTTAWMIPIFIFGTGWLREDWILLKRTAICDPFACWPRDEFARPLIGALSEFHYRVFRHHPGVIITYLNIVLAATAVAFYFLLRWRFSRSLSTAITFLWIAIPTHTALQHWVGVVHVTTAMFLAVASLLSYVHKRLNVGLSLALLSTLLYEGAFVVLFVGIAIVLFFILRVPKKTVFMHLGLLAGIMVLIFFGAVETREQMLVPVGNVLINVFAFGLFKNGLGDVPLVVAIASVCIAFYVFVRSRRIVSDAHLLIIVGTAVIVLGTIPFATSGFDNVFRNGIVDRASMMTGFGSAMVWGGILLAIASRVRTHSHIAVMVGALGIGMALMPHSLAIHRDYGQLIWRTRAAASDIARSPEGRAGAVTIEHIDDEQAGRLGISWTQEIRIRSSVYHPHIKFTIAEKSSK